MSVDPGIEVAGVRPHAAPCFTRRLLDVSVAVIMGGDCVPFPDQPFPDVPALAGHGANQPPGPVHTLDRNLDLPASDLPNECALHALPVPEPVPVPMFGVPVVFGRVEPGGAHFLSGHPHSAAVGHIRLACDRAEGKLPTLCGGRIQPPPIPARTLSGTNSTQNGKNGNERNQPPPSEDRLKQHDLHTNCAQPGPPVPVGGFSGVADLSDCVAGRNNGTAREGSIKCRLRSAGCERMPAEYPGMAMKGPPRLQNRPLPCRSRAIARAFRAEGDEREHGIGGICPETGVADCGTAI